jgi:hypothetical protein
MFCWLKERCLLSHELISAEYFISKIKRWKLGHIKLFRNAFCGLFIKLSDIEDKTRQEIDYSLNKVCIHSNNNKEMPWRILISIHGSFPQFPFSTVLLIMLYKLISSTPIYYNKSICIPHRSLHFSQLTI